MSFHAKAQPLMVSEHFRIGGCCRQQLRHVGRCSIENGSEETSNAVFIGGFELIGREIHDTVIIHHGNVLRHTIVYELDR